VFLTHLGSAKGRPSSERLASTLPAASDPTPPHRPLSAEADLAVTAASDLARLFALAGLEIKGDRLVEEGAPSSKIVGTAELIEASLVVMGTEGGGGLRRMLLGSVAEDVLHEAPCSVLLVRHQKSGGK
jgi:nucleotide-binding universal stress UspA family protein